MTISKTRRKDLSLKDSIEKMQMKIMDTDIEGCITGSSLADWDMDDPEYTPDIDIFTYSPYAMVHAIDVLEYKLGLVSGGDEITTDAGERWKARKVRTSGRGNRDLATCKFTDGTVVVNVSNRKYEKSAMDVIARFDMSIVLQAYDIPSGTLIDIRDCQPKADIVDIIGSYGGDPMVAVPNPFRSFDGTTWNAAKWLRQWDRVIKYWNRGFDTLPMARFYRHMIKEVIEGGSLFKTEASKQAYQEFVDEFQDLGTKIDEWIKEKE